MGDFKQKSFNDSLPFSKVFNGNTFVGQVSLVLFNNKQPKNKAQNTTTLTHRALSHGKVECMTSKFLFKIRNRRNGLNAEMSSWKSEVTS